MNIENLNEFSLIEKVKENYNVTKIKRKGNELLIAIELPDERFNNRFDFCRHVEQYYKTGNTGFYYVILKFELQPKQK